MTTLLYGADNRELIWKPNKGPQTAFLASPAREVLYGGAAAGGKTDAVLLGALRYADHPLHRAILFRRTRPQLQEVIDRAQVLYPEIVPGAYWHEKQSRYILPSGAYIQMGYAEHEDDILAFKTFEYNYIGFDELTSFTKRMYTFMFSRNRSKSRDLPLMIRAASNPGDIGHEWVFERFIQKREPYKIYEEKERLIVGNKTFDVEFTRQFIPAKVSDNPMLPDPEGYIAGLLQMGEEGQQYLHGVWIRLGGTMFKKLPDEIPAKINRASPYHVVMSVDYGINDPTAVYWGAVYDNNNVDIMGELYVNETSVDEVVRQIKDYEHMLGMRTPTIRVADPKMFARDPTSMQSVASMFEAKGLSLTKANNDRLAGWAQLLRFIWSNQLRVWQGVAPNLYRTLPALVRDPIKQNDIKGRQEDHSADSLRYLSMAVYENISGDTRKQEDEPGDSRMMDMEYEKVLKAAQGQHDRSAYIDDLGEW